MTAAIGAAIILAAVAVADWRARVSLAKRERDDAALDRLGWGMDR